MGIEVSDMDVLIEEQDGEGKRLSAFAISQARFYATNLDDDVARPKYQ